MTATHTLLTFFTAKKRDYVPCCVCVCVCIVCVYCVCLCVCVCVCVCVYVFACVCVCDYHCTCVQAKIAAGIVQRAATATLLWARSSIYLLYESQFTCFTSTNVQILTQKRADIPRRWSSPAMRTTRSDMRTSTTPLEGWRCRLIGMALCIRRSAPLMSMTATLWACCGTGSGFSTRRRTLISCRASSPARCSSSRRRPLERKSINLRTPSSTHNSDF